MTSAAAASAAELSSRLQALADAVELAERHGLAAADARRVVERSRERLRHGSAWTVVALAGPTGSGKSSLVNALALEEAAFVGVRRPTTSEALACVFFATDGVEDPAALLRWLGVRRRHHVADPPSVLRGLILLDLPDFDSIALDHHAQVDRLLPLVDRMVWVTDPQKYADEALHGGYLRSLAGHAGVIDVVLNKSDTLRPADCEACVADLTRLLRADGLDGVKPLAVAAVTGAGLPALRDRLAAVVAQRRAAVARIEADLASAAAGLRHGEPAGAGGGVPAAARERLIDGLSRAAGVESVRAVVAAQHRRDAVLRTGWPPARWLRRWRRPPLAALPAATRSAIAGAEVGGALRDVGEAAAAALPQRWGDRALEVARGRHGEVVSALDRGTSLSVQRLLDRPRWWALAGRLHVTLLLAALAGALWLAGLVAAESLLLVDVEPYVPRVRGLPLPTVLLAGGLTAGVLLAWLARLAARAGAARRARRAAAALRREVAEVADAVVVAPLDEVVADHRRLAELLDVASGARTHTAGSTAAL